MVSTRWAASVAVIAAMTAGTAAVSTDSPAGGQDPAAYADPPDDA